MSLDSSKAASQSKRILIGVVEPIGDALPVAASAPAPAAANKFLAAPPVEAAVPAAEAVAAIDKKNGIAVDPSLPFVLVHGSTVLTTTTNMLPAPVYSPLERVKNGITEGLQLFWQLIMADLKIHCAR